jgi:myosin heavy subunit
MENVTLSLNVNQLNVILGALGKAPYEAVFGLVEDINKQVVPQLQAAQAQRQAPEGPLGDKVIN